MQIQQLRKKLPLIIAIICGILAILLLNIYLQSRENEMVEQVKEFQKQQALSQAKSEPEAPPQKIGIALVAQKAIPAQTPISPGDIAIKELPMGQISSAAVKSLDEVIGQIAAGPIAAGEQILKANLLPPANIGKSLSEITPSGERAVAITIDDASNIIGFIKPGDFVDVFALISPPSGRKPAPKGQGSSSSNLISLFQNIKVLAVGADFGQTSGTKATSAPAARTVTFALTPQEVVLLSFVQEHGKIKLALRSSEDGDTKKEFVKPVDWDTLFRYLYPSKESVTEDSGPEVEIYRGVEKEVIPLRGK